jgi:integrase
VRYITGRSKYVFASIRSPHKPISENAIGYLYNREGYQGRHVPHGWRSSFSTTINEIAMHEARQDANALGDRLIIALMLAHTPIGISASEMRYNRSRYMPRRRQLAQIWADMIMESALPASELIDSVRRKDA